MRCHNRMLLQCWELALHQRPVDQQRQERQQQVDELVHQERWHWVKRAGYNQRLKRLVTLSTYRCYTNNCIYLSIYTIFSAECLQFA